ncbi:cadmium, zinc and cobalt-transporting ATPase [Clostridium acetireducens DSM 10703]|uniref:Cd(2+)-exporting ATPase n=1 Tax=Clostridium acetireducens DSM 10703 TaxID=1121290 RepID=A0A1E8F065_9CLOT|nr:heavy metal translocating P-type ATPase [Clostridium acetireducens]OFI06679.1 cadmium, zinc and cobalt-transporting ATPase [Clostridium acetireducens DSM 10703]
MEIKKLIIGGVVFAAGYFTKSMGNISIILFLASYIIIGSEVLMNSVKNLLKGDLFDENFLMSVASIGAILVKQYPEAVAVMFLYELGEYLQDRAADNSRESILELMDIRPDYANILRDSGDIYKVSPEDVKIGDIIVIKPGEKIPLDGKIVEGNSLLDVSALTGESLPKEVYEGDTVLSGSINKNQLLKIEVVKNFNESTASKILDLVENASSKKAKAEKFITKFAKIYTPIVVCLALLLAIVPNFIFKDTSVYTWIYRASVFLVVSCPCALVISIPLSFFAGIGKASKSGILIKGGNYLEALNNIEAIVFDKTGTLTKGTFKISSIKPEDFIKENELLEYAAYLESLSNHPIAKSIVKAYKGDINKEEIKEFTEIPGRGLKAIIKCKEVSIGNEKLMEEMGIKINKSEEYATVLYVVIDKQFAGYIAINDEVKEDSKTTIEGLNKMGINKTVILSGDKKYIAESLGKSLGISKIYSELLPQQKLEKLETLEKEKSPENNIVYVGDGINDAPALARADIGISMGGVGSDAAIEASDVVIMKDEPSKIIEAINIAKTTRKVIIQNLIFIFAVKISVLILAALGIANMWLAIFADVGVALIAVVNSMRIISIKVSFKKSENSEHCHGGCCCCHKH